MIIPMEQEYRQQYYELQEKIFDSGFWSDGEMLKNFEQEFGSYVKLGCRAVSNCGIGLLAILEYIGVQEKDVIVPANTFWATAQAVRKAGGHVIFADCNKEDLCLSLEDLKVKKTKNTKAVIVVHIGGHIAFQIEEIAEYCRENDLILIEDCAHVHGGWWNGKTGGHYGFAGAYSFYATKTMPLGEGGMVVSKNEHFLEWLEYYRNYGKKVVNNKVTYPIKNGFNYRMNEFCAALGIIQLRRLPMILKWKKSLASKYDNIFQKHIQFPKGMESGYYKYIIFETPSLKEETGQVFGINDLCSEIAGEKAFIPNSRWIAQNHKCVPIYYGYENADKTAEELRKLLLEE